jgi:cytidylate kinase
MIVTIDGPAGAGKSTAARALARRLGFEFLDTGAMFRAVTLAALRAGSDLGDQEALARLLLDFDLRMEGNQVFLGGEEVTAAIRSPAVTAASRAVADSPVVRKHLAKLQRSLAAGRDIVCEGRDQGTIVFPDAACKFFLVADPLERARRRHREMQNRGETPALEEVLRAQQDRDRRDASRNIAPMVAAADAIHLDSTGLSIEQVVEGMAGEVRRRHKK